MKCFVFCVVMYSFVSLLVSFLEMLLSVLFGIICRFVRLALICIAFFLYSLVINRIYIAHSSKLSYDICSKVDAIQAIYAHCHLRYSRRVQQERNKKTRCVTLHANFELIRGELLLAQLNFE